MDQESSLGKMAESTLDSMLMTKNKDMAFLHGQITDSIMATGKTVIITEKGSILILSQFCVKGNGSREN